MITNHFDVQGLSDLEVIESRKKFGQNRLNYKKTNTILEAIKNLVREPMILLLLVAASIYFISGKISDGIFMASAIVLVAMISLYQDSRSRNALEKLKQFTQNKCNVIRNGNKIEINTEDLVIGDLLIAEEGSSISADGTIIQSNDFSVNESILTGESYAVFKDQKSIDNQIFLGTTVSSGLAIATITAIGNETKLGKIGKSLENIDEQATPLEIQISQFVKKMVYAGALVFVLVWGINYYHTHLILSSLIKALTLAMSILPEEIPVAFTTFMALGAWRLMKMGIIVKQMKTVETLGSATVICTDKTGTITENRMSLVKLFDFETNGVFNIEDIKSKEASALIKLAMWASEPIPFDPMEVAIHNAYDHYIIPDERKNYKIIHEYPLSGKPPMMTHLFENHAGHRIIAIKGAPEALINSSKLSAQDIQLIEKIMLDFASEGYRILAIGESNFDGNQFPKTQQEFNVTFKGLVAFYDPPKKNINYVLQQFYDAGISVKIVTGDNPITTTSIAKQIGFKGFDKNLTGDELMKLSDIDLQKRVADTNLFTRMFPEAKLRIINALKSNNEIVAMTGDGVNDGPALKAAHIGIAMGKKGSEIAKQAASLILLEDDLSKMVDAIGMGRKIYSNLKKAIQYIISIHIPIILTVFIPLILGWVYPNIFSPIHVIFLELIMGPTCSIIYENEPLEKNTLFQKPRPYSNTFFNWTELNTSILQGLIITIGTLFIYQFAVYHGFNETITRSMVFTTLISANILLTLINRSFYYSILTTLRYKNNLVIYIILITVGLLGMLIYIKPLAQLFEFEALNFIQLIFSISTGFVSVIWYEAIKWKNRKMNG
ncbi:MAG: cation-translocating P-type ATPase [Saprospiraceae bacterium]|jgi:Ca2+-transporting ATPase|nr:cation-translocating P-type ATPase [Saprospiraceae bacterium]